MGTLVIYHSNCADGFGAAYAAWLVSSGWEFYPGVYQNAPPDVTGKQVYLLDFCYKRAVVEAMALTAEKITILDHHKSRAEDWVTGGYPANVVPMFDMDHSGAMMAWKFFHPETPVPALIRHIEDRDLWRFALAGTREIQANLFSYPYDFVVWHSLMQADVHSLISDGAAIERKHHKDIAELVRITTRIFDIGGHHVPVANLPYTLTSDAGHLLAVGTGTDAAPQYPFAACYWDTPEGRVFSLRSVQGGEDVSDIAKRYGGGGHRNASGFRVAHGAAPHPVS